MKNKIVLALSIIFMILLLIILTGCKKNSNDTNKSNSNNDINSIVGKYELVEMKASDIPISAEDWKKSTTMEYEFEFKDNNTAIQTITYKENMQEKSKKKTDKNNYTYDDHYLYKANNNENEEKKAWFEYEFKSGELTLKLINSINNDCYVYKKK